MIASWLASHWYWFIGPAFIALCVVQPALVWRFKWQALLLCAIALAVMQWMAASSLRTQLENLQLTSALERHRLESAARAAERKRVDDMAALDARLTKENQDALLARDNTIACLRNGTCRMRDRFTCPSRPAQAGTASGSGDGPAQGGLSGADGEFLVRFAAEADDVARQLTACQAVIASDRGQQ